MEPQNPAVPSATDDNPDDEQNIEVELTPQEYKTLLAERDAQIKKLKKEAMDKRHERNEAQKRADEAEMKRRMLAGEYEPVVQDLTAKVKTLEPYKELYEAVQAQIIARNNARIAAIPEQLRHRIPTKYSPEDLAEFLDANEKDLILPTAPDLDAGRRGAGQPSVQITQYQRDMADAMGIPIERYIEQAVKMTEEKLKKR